MATKRRSPLPRYRWLQQLTYSQPAWANYNGIKYPCKLLKSPFLATVILSVIRRIGTPPWDRKKGIKEGKNSFCEKDEGENDSNVIRAFVPSQQSPRSPVSGRFNTISADLNFLQVNYSFFSLGEYISASRNLRNGFRSLDIINDGGNAVQSLENYCNDSMFYQNVIHGKQRERA